MQIEQGITTQRLKLSRLVAGLLMVLGFVSLAPFSCACRRWFRGSVLSILTRAECATQNLVMAQAMVLAGRRGVRVDPARFFALSGIADRSDGGLPSLVALRERLKALGAMLDDLPRHGLHLLRRVIGKRLGRTNGGLSWPHCCWEDPFCDWGLVTPRDERPLDKAVGADVLLTSQCIDPSLPKSGGRRWRLS